MEITREQVEKWVKEQRVKNGLHCFSVSSMKFKESVGYTVHRTDEKCDTLNDTWEQAQKFMKKPWEIPPEGYRIVTDEERKEYDYPENCNFMWKHENTYSGWMKSKIKTFWKTNLSAESNAAYFAVPVDFVFETEHDKKVKELEGKIHTLTTELAELKQGEKK